MLAAAALLLVVLVTRLAMSEKAPLDNASLPPQLQKLVPLHTPLSPPRPGDWLDAYDEAGQNYRQYLASRPVRATPQRRTLYVQPLGEFTDTEFMRRYFQLPVDVLADIPLSVVSDKARRQSPLTGKPQILSTYVLDDLLRPRLPADALALIAFTSADLWPGLGWNFVFGQASLEHRVGVWSMHRLGDPDAGPEAFRLTLRRTLGIAAHETGHMLSMPHCTFYECCMCGSNHLEESDRYPLWLCPQCLAKLLHATSADPAKRFGDLIEFAKQHELDREAEFWQRELEALETHNMHHQ
jgi:archaemetzincin